MNQNIIHEIENLKLIIENIIRLIWILSFLRCSQKYLRVQRTIILSFCKNLEQKLQNNSKLSKTKYDFHVSDVYRFGAI